MSLRALPDDAPVRTMPAMVLRAGSRGPQPVLTARSADGQDHTLRSEQLTDAVASAAGVLAGHGLVAGEVVGLHLDNKQGLEALLLHLGAQWMGAVPVPVSPRMSPREVAEILAHCGAGMLVTAGEQRAVALKVATDALTVCDVTAGVMGLARTAVAQPPAPVDENDLADILYTSGMTGRPKGAEFTHGNCVSCGAELQHALGLGEGDVYQSGIPYFTSTGAHTNPLAAL